MAGDEYMTLRGERHGCYDQGDQGPYHASFGRMGAVDWSSFAGVTAIGLLMRKVKIPIASYAALGAFGARHVQGMYNWSKTGCE